MAAWFPMHRHRAIIAAAAVALMAAVGVAVLVRQIVAKEPEFATQPYPRYPAE